MKVLAKGEVVFDAAGPSASISVTNCEKIRIQGVTVINAPTQGILVVNSSKVSLKGCTVTDHSTQGVQISGSERASVKKCTVTGGTDGIQITGASSASVSGNTVSGQSNKGIFVVGITLPGTKISKNDISGAGNAGIELAGPGNKAERNSVANCLFGIVTTFGASDMTGSAINKNTITDTAVGLRAYASGGMVFSKNTVENASASALQIASTSEDVVVTKNKVDGANAGFDDEGARSSVSKNKIAGTASYGIRARGADGIFEKNQVKDTPGNGIDVWTGGNTFTKNTATGNTGLDLDSTRQTESANTYVKNRFDTTDFAIDQ